MFKFSGVIFAVLAACAGDSTAPEDSADSTAPEDSGVGSDSTTYDLVLGGSGYTPHIGNTVAGAVLDAAGAVVATDSATMGDDGELSLTFVDALEAGGTYRVDWYADLNANGQCDAAPTDHQWSAAIEAVTGDVEVTYDHDTNFADVCATF
jgi:hypothetical protein